MSVIISGALVMEVNITGTTPPPFSPPTETDYSSSDGGTHLEAPAVQLRVGRGVFRAADLTEARTAAVDRAEATFAVPRRGKVLHLVFQTFRAGAPFSPALAVATVSTAGTSRIGVGDT